MDLYWITRSVSSGIWHDTTRHDTTRHDTTRHDTTRHDTTRHGTARHGTARHGTARHGTARHTAHGTRHTAHGTRHTAHGTRHTAHGTRHDMTRHDTWYCDLLQNWYTTREAINNLKRWLKADQIQFFYIDFINICIIDKNYRIGKNDQGQYYLFFQD